MLEKFLVDMVKRRAVLESNVFEHAPKDWADFQGRFGEWREVNRLVIELEKAVKGIEDDQL